MNLLHKLRKRLTALNAVVSGLILLAMAMGALLFTRAQFTQSSANAFAHAADTIAYQLQSDSLIRHTYLTDTELSQSLILHIEDGGIPFQWKGAYASKTPREALIARAQAQAAQNGVFMEYAPITSRNYIAQIRGDYGDAYRVSVWVLPSGHSWSAIVTIKDMAEEQAVLTRITLIFLGCMLVGVLAQISFSYVFAGRAIGPVARANKEQKEFVQAASHELRTPLAVMQASADALLKAEGEDAQDFVAAIRQQSRHMAHLVDDMLFLASADTQSLPMRFAPVEMSCVLEEVADSFMPLMQAKHIAFMYEPSALPAISGDELRLKQVVQILLDNAVEHASEGGTICLSASYQNRIVEISVSDNGPGVSDGDKPHIFKRFYRADKSRSRTKAHYGIGLSIAYEIMTLHQGWISVSDRVGGGAMFSLRFKMH